ECVEAAADTEREDPVGAECGPVDGGPARAQPGELEHRGERDNDDEQGPTRSHDQPGHEADGHADDDRPDRLVRGERATGGPHAGGQPPRRGSAHAASRAESPIPPRDPEGGTHAITYRTEM